MNCGLDSTPAEKRLPDRASFAAAKREERWLAAHPEAAELHMEAYRSVERQRAERHAFEAAMLCEAQEAEDLAIVMEQLRIGRRIARGLGGLFG